MYKKFRVKTASLLIANYSHIFVRHTWFLPISFSILIADLITIGLGASGTLTMKSLILSFFPVKSLACKHNSSNGVLYKNEAKNKMYFDFTKKKFQESDDFYTLKFPGLHS